jgi:NAD-dependent dihydropyrimidine dehydrogenase PreA subunit
MYWVDEEICLGCGDCVEACPAGAIALVDGIARIDQANCAECGDCASTCPEAAISSVPASLRARKVIPRSTSLLPVPGSMADDEVTRRVHRVEVAVPPAEVRTSRFWPAVGTALVWAARDLLPAALRAWQETAARVGPASTTGLRRGVGAGAIAGRRRSRWRARQGGVRIWTGSGSPKRNGW